jgi:hypothetical protein
MYRVTVVANQIVEEAASDSRVRQLRLAMKIENQDRWRKGTRV